MLVSLLPGVRELRAPLAAGYLWLVTFWIALAPRVPALISTEGVYRDIYNLGQAVGKPAIAIASAFVAYLIGTLSVGVTSVINLRLSSSNRFSAAVKTPIAQAVLERIEERLKADSKLLEQADSKLLEQALSSVRAHFSALNETGLTLSSVRTHFSALNETGLTLIDAIDKFEISLDLREFTYRHSPTTDSQTITNIWYKGASAGHEPLAAAMILALQKDSDFTFLMSNATIRRQLIRGLVDLDSYVDDCIEDLPSLAVRLVGKEPEVYGAYDRLRAESEFRLGVAVPLAALFLTMAYRSAPIWVLGVLICVALAELGRRSSMQAFAQLAESLHAKRLESPVLEGIGAEPLRIRPVEDPAHEIEKFLQPFVDPQSGPHRSLTIENLHVPLPSVQGTGEETSPD
jgi:DNA-binding transcriptional ArsR family regulator